jgi:sugar-specific transcriptional regulator TrmB
MTRLETLQAELRDLPLPACKMYLALVIFGPLTVSEMHKHTKLSKKTIYRHFSHLILRKLVKSLEGDSYARI